MKKISAIIFIILFIFSFSNLSFSQGLLDKIKEKVEERVDEETDEAIDAGLDETEEAIKNGGDEQAEDEQSSDQTSEQIEQDAGTDHEENVPPTKKEEEFKSYSKFDFIPGDKIIFYDDFAQDNVGDFPATWNTNGSGEVMTTNLFPGHWFKITGEGWYIPGFSQTLPDNFTAQFDVIPQPPSEESDDLSFGFYIYEGNPDDPNEGGAIPGVAGIKIFFSENGHSYSNYADGSYIIDGSKQIDNLLKNKVNKISIWVQKQRIRIYMEDSKIFDVPKGIPAGHKPNLFRVEVSQGRPMFSNLRVAVGAPDMRNKLITEGKLVTRGILFDVNSDKIKPESYGTLKEIANVLKENESVRVMIVGHTDSDGSDQSNLDLSKKRAASVKNSLSKEFGIDEARMETNGKGESEPTDKNDSPQGKTSNRRVEFIKL